MVYNVNINVTMRLMDVTNKYNDVILNEEFLPNLITKWLELYTKKLNYVQDDCNVTFPNLLVKELLDEKFKLTFEHEDMDNISVRITSTTVNCRDDFDQWDIRRVIANYCNEIELFPKFLVDLDATHILYISDVDVDVEPIMDEE